MIPPRKPSSPFDLSWLDVMVVDDEMVVNQTVRDMLHQMGVPQTCFARDGVEALRLLEREVHPVNLIVADWNMPRLNGIELFSDVRASAPEIGFILLTGRCDAASVLEARSRGVDAYLRKPFSLQQLRTRLVSVSLRMQSRPEAAA